ncbi:hypothetical protein B0H14DRAFT_3471055 [Mycena olivaceomarginata]|nr:hypothetical protein B0H14DRAFT_3471055 [Mycena olivaceomarginata]
MFTLFLPSTLPSVAALYTFFIFEPASSSILPILSSYGVVHLSLPSVLHSLPIILLPYLPFGALPALVISIISLLTTHPSLRPSRLHTHTSFQLPPSSLFVVGLWSSLLSLFHVILYSVFLPFLSCQSLTLVSHFRHHDWEHSSICNLKGPTPASPPCAKHRLTPTPPHPHPSMLRIRNRARRTRRSGSAWSARRSASGRIRSGRTMKQLGSRAESGGGGGHKEAHSPAQGAAEAGERVADDARVAVAAAVCILAPDGVRGEGRREAEVVTGGGGGGGCELGEGAVQRSPKRGFDESSGCAGGEGESVAKRARSAYAYSGRAPSREDDDTHNNDDAEDDGEEDGKDAEVDVDGDGVVEMEFGDDEDLEDAAEDAEERTSRSSGTSGTSLSLSLSPPALSSSPSLSSLSSVSPSPPPEPVPVAMPEKPLTRREHKKLGLPKTRATATAAGAGAGAKGGAGKIVIPGGRFEGMGEWRRNGTGRLDVRGFRELKI